MDKKILTIAIALFILLAPIFYAQARADIGAIKKLDVSSSAFKQDGRIPAKYTCDGENLSPPISWGEGPAATGSYALIMQDPDAPSGTLTHWLMLNIPSNKTGLNENIPAMDRLADSSVQGKNYQGKAGYTGPCPPPGSQHHYHIRVYALDTTLSLSPDVTAAELQRAMSGHILAEGELTGIYGR